MRAHSPGFGVLDPKLRLLRESPVLDKSFFSREGKLSQGQSPQSQGQEGEADTSRLGVSWDPAGRKNLEITGSTWTFSPWSPQSPFSVQPVWDGLFFSPNNKYSLGLLRWVQWLRLHIPNAGGLNSIPGQGTRSHMPQIKIPHATTNTQHSQIDNF